MVRKSQFKLITRDKDITEKLSKNLISLSYEDKEKDESDEMSFLVFLGFILSLHLEIA